MGYSFAGRLPLGRDSQQRHGFRGFLGLYNPGLWRFVRQGIPMLFFATGLHPRLLWITYLASKLSRFRLPLWDRCHHIDASSVDAWETSGKRLFWPVLYRLASQVIAPSSGTRDLLTFPRDPRKRIRPDPLCRRQRWWKARIGTGRSHRRPRLFGRGSWTQL